MYRRTSRASLLLVIALITVAASMSVPSAPAAASRGLASVGRRFKAPTLTLAPCTKPLFGPNKDCESTSPKVDRWWTSTAADSSCTLQFQVDWDDGTSSTRNFVDAPKGLHLIASHAYKGYTEYSEVVTSSVLSGSCTPVPATTFEITHLPSSLPSWLDALGILPGCFDDFIPGPVDIGLKEIDLGDALGLYKIGKKLGALFKVIDRAGTIYLLLFELPFDCAVKAGSHAEDRGSSIPGILGPLPRAYAYGARHPGKLFEPSGKVPPRPRIKAINGYQKGNLVYFTISYTNPRHDAKGFGFVGIKGAGWAEENHPFSSPSYGIVGHDRISYPFNLACGTPQQYKSYVAAWIYDKAHVRSKDVEIALTCTS